VIQRSGRLVASLVDQAATIRAPALT